MAEKKDKTLAELSDISKRLRERSAKLEREARALADEIERIKQRAKKATDKGRGQ